ncbi:hypothetical protein ABZ807_30875 [Micromonospora sp. NPDC047548]|uniref:hypothetical protein n=1 Tax=Micromonospora sp. NPDC047548 TaxID=3155624 RepID=UPI00340E4507
MTPTRYGDPIGPHLPSVAVQHVVAQLLPDGPRPHTPREEPMSLYTLPPKPGCERYTIQVGWNPHRGYFATVVDFAWDPVTDPDNEPDSLRIGLVETILDPTEVLLAVAPYADIPDDLPAALRTDQATHPVRR